MNNKHQHKICILTSINANSGKGASCVPTNVDMAPIVPVVRIAKERAARGEFITAGNCKATRIPHSTVEAPASSATSARIYKSTVFNLDLDFSFSIWFV